MHKSHSYLCIVWSKLLHCYWLAYSKFFKKQISKYASICMQTCKYKVHVLQIPTLTQSSVMALQLKITVFITLLKIIHIQGFYRTFLFGLRCTLFINGNLPGTHIQAKNSYGLIITNNYYT